MDQVIRSDIVTHPLSLTSASADGFQEFGTLLSRDRLEKHFTLRLDKTPVHLTDNFIFLGQILRKNNFEGLLTFDHKDVHLEPDTVPEDSALVCKTPKGLVIITGCSHAGICNIITGIDKFFIDKHR